MSVCVCIWTLVQLPLKTKIGISSIGPGATVLETKLRTSTRGPNVTKYQEPFFQCLYFTLYFEMKFHVIWANLEHIM